MSLYNFLGSCVVDSLKSKEFLYDFHDDVLTINYEEYQKKYKDEVISSYFLFDISKFDDKSLQLINNFDNFMSFQESFISKLFFSCATNLKFNLYLIFAYSDGTPLTINQEVKSKIEWNLDYSRKIFLKYSELKKYFSYYDVLESFKPSKKYENSKFETIKQCVIKLDNYGLKSALVTKITPENKTELEKSILRTGENIKLNYDSIKNNNISSDKFFEKYFVNARHKKNNKNRRNQFEFKHIDKIVNDSFRKNVLKQDEIRLKKFNLLCGENASGKTSLLELIEYTLTGKTRKDDKTSGFSIIYSTNGNAFSSEQSKNNSVAIKNAWYSDKIGSLNKLFCRINYFDIDAAYNFAVEYERTKYQDFFLRLSIAFYEGKYFGTSFYYEDNRKYNRDVYIIC